MRNFQIIKIETGMVRLVEIYTYNGVNKDFSGSTCISDALRHMKRICRGERKFEILTVTQATR